MRSFGSLHLRNIHHSVIYLLINTRWAHASLHALRSVFEILHPVCCCIWSFSMVPWINKLGQFGGTNINFVASLHCLCLFYANQCLILARNVCQLDATPSGPAQSLQLIASTRPNSIGPRYKLQSFFTSSSLVVHCVHSIFCLLTKRCHLRNQTTAHIVCRCEAANKEQVLVSLLLASDNCANRILYHLLIGVLSSKLDNSFFSFKFDHFSIEFVKNIGGISWAHTSDLVHTR